MGHGDRRKCKAALNYFVLTHVIAVTNFTVRRLVAERPARRPSHIDFPTLFSQPRD
jgi:hypothetical protein